MITDTRGKPCMSFYGKAGGFFPEQKYDYPARRVLGVKRIHPDSPLWEEWIKQQLDKLTALTEERQAKIAAIVAGSRQRAMDRTDQFDQSA
jgi:hypothetical protein